MELKCVFAPIFKPSCIIYKCFKRIENNGTKVFKKKNYLRTDYLSEVTERIGEQIK